MKIDYEMLKDMTLPSWLEDQLPEPLPCLSISFEDGRFHVSNNDRWFASICDAYDYAVRFRGEYQIIFDESVDGHGGRLDGPQFFAERVHAETGQPYESILSALDTDNALFGLKHSYFVWLTQYSFAYTDTPYDFFNAYNFLSHHPLFWVKSDIEPSYCWVTNKGLQFARISLVKKKDGSVMVSLSHGPHKRPDYVGYRNDSNLVAHGRSYEDAVIMLAVRVHECFDLDGYERQK